MKIICVIYNESEDKVLLKKSLDGHHFVGFKGDIYSLQLYTSDLLKRDILKSDWATLYKSEDHIILLLNSDDINIENHEWVDLTELKDFVGPNKQVVNRVLNYFLRVGKLKMKPLYFTITCEDEDVLNQCIEYMIMHNPGIGVVDANDCLTMHRVYKMMFVRNVSTVLPDFVQEIKFTSKEIDEYINNMSIQDIYKSLMIKVSELYQHVVMDHMNYTACSFYGITGMTESGKSYYANHLDLKYNMWNLKIRSFIEEAKHLVDNLVPQLIECVAIQTMVEFSCFHYFKDALVVESIYSERFHLLMSKVLKERYKLIYIDAEEEIRLQRSLDSLEEFKRKDVKKKNMGIDKLSKVADVVIDNAHSIELSQDQLNCFLNNKGV